jgi:hypothetical protein
VRAVSATCCAGFCAASRVTFAAVAARANDHLAGVPARHRDRDPLVQHVRPVERAAGGGDHVGRVGHDRPAGRPAQREQRRPDQAGVVRLDRQDLGGRPDQARGEQQRRGPGVRGHADVLEQERAEQEAALALERVERLAGRDQPGRLGGGGEAGDHVDGRAGYRVLAEGGPQRADVGLLIRRDLGCVVPDGLGGERHGLPP